MKNDLISYKFLRNLSDNRLTEFRVPKVKQIASKSIRLEYIAGLTIRDIQNRKSLPKDSWPTTASSIRLKFEELIQELTKSLKDSGEYDAHFISVATKGMIRARILNTKQNISHSIFLKNDNIVYRDKDKSFWIIDPF
ncbi:MAG: hypothetical protein AB8E15_10535 [Bdellovibrionales bacterium]